MVIEVIITTCKNCKYWDLDGEGWGLKANRAGWHDCLNPNLLAVPFGEGVEMEGIGTSPEFGCLQFTAREVAGAAPGTERPREKS